MAQGLQHFPHRAGDGRPPLLPDEEILRLEPSVAIALAHQPPQSPGTLFITTKRVIWLSDADRDKGYAVNFLSVSLHAVSRDPEAYPSPCIYAQIDVGEEEEEEESEGSDSEASADGFDLSKVTEMRLVPSDPNQLDALFDIFCQCAELNPEPREEGEEENTWFFGDEEMTDDVPDFGWQFSDNLANPIGYANGGHDLASSVRELQIDDQRFQDADDVDDDSQDEHHGPV